VKGNISNDFHKLILSNCGQLDSVRKVSAIVSAGTSSGMYSGYGDSIGYSAHGLIVMDEIITLSGSSQTQLCRLLSPPKQPNYVSFTTMLKHPYGIFLIFLGFFGLIILPILWFIGVAFILGTIWVFLYWALASEKEKTLLITEMPRWQGANSKWQRLYYCYRCDGVYLPGESYIVPSQHMKDFLYHNK
jgi:hypothetical protein